ncbi:glh-2, partial [Symbiodinium sp. CCMP2456]
DAKEALKPEGALQSRDPEVGTNGIEPSRHGEATLDLTDVPPQDADVKVAEERTSSQTSPSQ